MLIVYSSQSDNSFNPIALIVVGVIVVAILLFCIIKKARDVEYETFVKEHSLAIRSLNTINKKYSFKEIKPFDMGHSYDNENFYNEISPEDYLTYELVYIGKKVTEAINDSRNNKKLFDVYTAEVGNLCERKRFDTTELLKDTNKLHFTEERIFRDMLFRPQIEVNIKVRLELTNINGDYKDSKWDSFTSAKIEQILKRLRKKSGNYYLDEGIWHSICKVERGKVTNKIRFQIYERDGYRCRKCHRKTNDLEIDHIIPIAKGGKSTFNNLQTLCHRCNVEKGANLE